jgi:septal ring factor EnvC (AmiA/AmiB activator)
MLPYILVSGWAGMIVGYGIVAIIYSRYSRKDRAEIEALTRSLRASDEEFAERMRIASEKHYLVEMELKEAKGQIKFLTEKLTKLAADNERLSAKLSLAQGVADAVQARATLSALERAATWHDVQADTLEGQCKAIKKDGGWPDRAREKIASVHRASAAAIRAMEKKEQLLR